MAIQSLTHGTRVLKNKEVLSVADKVWNDTSDVVMMPRGWMSYYQIITANIEMKDDNTYLQRKVD